MRLIDADKAERDIEELRKSHWFNSPYLTKERKIGLSEAFDMIQGVCIKHAPTVDAEPIRHGMWKYVTVVDEGFWRCSSCGTPSEASGAKVLYKYCPFCGAKMDGDKNDSD